MDLPFLKSLRITNKNKTIMIKFLDLEKVTAGHANEINEAVSRVVNSDGIFWEKEVEKV